MQERLCICACRPDGCTTKGLGGVFSVVAGKADIDSIGAAMGWAERLPAPDVAHFPLDLLNVVLSLPPLLQVLLKRDGRQAVRR